MEEGETGKRQTQEEKPGSPTTKRLRWSKMDEGSSGDPGEDTLPWLSADQSDGESVADLWKQLERTDAKSTSPTWAPTRIRFIDKPYSAQLIFQSSSSYITINGNEETCGSSFSDSESSVMASVDMAGTLSASVSLLRGLGVWFAGEEKGMLGSSEAEARGWVVWGGGYGGDEEMEMEMEMDGCYGFDRNWGWEWDDVELTRFLGTQYFE